MQKKPIGNENLTSTRNTGFMEVNHTYLKNKPNTNITKTTDQKSKTNLGKNQSNLSNNHGIYSYNKTVMTYLDKSLDQNIDDNNTYNNNTSSRISNLNREKIKKKYAQDRKGISYDKYLLIKDKTQTKHNNNINKDKIDSQSKEYCVKNIELEKPVQHNMFHGLTQEKEDVESNGNIVNFNLDLQNEEENRANVVRRQSVEQYWEEGEDMLDVSFGNDSTKKSDNLHTNLKRDDAISIDNNISDPHSPIPTKNYNENLSMSEILDKQEISDYKERKRSMNRDDQMISRKSMNSISGEFKKSTSNISDFYDGRNSTSGISDNLNIEYLKKEQNIMTRCNKMEKMNPIIQKKYLTMIRDLKNPPRSLNNLLEALFSLLYEIYAPIDSNFFENDTKKFFVYKSYMRNTESLYTCIKSLKKYLENQGILYRNILKCREALQKFKEFLWKQKDNSDSEEYRVAVKNIQEYLEYFVDYYDILVELNLEPKTNQRNDSFFKENGKIDQSQNLDISDNILNGENKSERTLTTRSKAKQVDPMIKSKNGTSYKKKTCVYKNSKFNM